MPPASPPGQGCPRALLARFWPHLVAGLTNLMRLTDNRGFFGLGPGAGVGWPVASARATNEQINKNNKKASQPPIHLE
jgi:hypothetical protein